MSKYCYFQLIFLKFCLFDKMLLLAFLFAKNITLKSPECTSVSNTVFSVYWLGIKNTNHCFESSPLYSQTKLRGNFGVVKNSKMSKFQLGKVKNKLGLSWDKLSKDVLAGQGLFSEIVLLWGCLPARSSSY